MSRHGPYRSAPTYPTVHRNPWSGGPVHCSDSRSTQSSGSSHTYHVLNGPCIDTYYHEPDPHAIREQSVMGGYRMSRHPLEAGTCMLPPESSGKYLLSRALPPRPHLQPIPTATIPHEPNQILDNGRRSRPVSSRAGTPVSGEATVIVPCGGHCTALENFCHYFLQVLFVGGVLSGVCLVVAGRVVLRSDLSVLTYIGSLTGLVCGVLLWVQCLVRRGPRRRHHRPPPPPPQGPPEAIPLQTLQPPPYTLRPNAEHHDFREESGIPWWRRETMGT